MYFVEMERVEQHSVDIPGFFLSFRIYVKLISENLEVQI